MEFDLFLFESSTLWKELKNNNLKKIKKEFVVKRLKSQPIFFIILHHLFEFHVQQSSNLHFNLLLLLSFIAYRWVWTLIY